MDKTLNRKSMLAVACIFIATPLAAQTPTTSETAKAEPVLFAAAFVPTKASTEAAKPIADRPLSTETMKAEPIAALPKLSFPATVSANTASNVVVQTASAAQIVPAAEAPTSRRFGPVTVEPGKLSYATEMGTNINAIDRFGAVPGVTRLTFGR